MSNTKQTSSKAKACFRRHSLSVVLVSRPRLSSLVLKYGQPDNSRPTKTAVDAFPFVNRDSFEDEGRGGRTRTIRCDWLSERQMRIYRRQNPSPLQGRGRQVCSHLRHALAQVILLGLIALTGCDATSTVTLPVSNFTTWKLPADGTRIPAPRALYTSTDDTVYALDDAGRVLVYSASGEIINTWHMPEYDTGRPEGVIELLDGRIAVADTHYHRVVFFHPDGTVESMLGEKGIDAGQFVYPVAIAQDPNGFIYVGEYGDRQRIQKFSADGTFVTQFGKHGTGPGQFQRPSGIVWTNGTIYAVDAFNNRIQAFKDTGEFLNIIELPDNFDALEFPYDIRGTADGRLYVVENKAARITVLEKDGSLVGRYGLAGRGDGNFFTPWSLTVMSDGRILVADTGNHRIVELTL